MNVRGAPPDAEVVALVLAGDTEAFGIVIRRYEAGLLRFATRMLGSRDAAADAVAESFVRAYRHLASCREPARLRTWLYRIVTNRCKSHLVRRSLADVPLDDAPPGAFPRAARDALARDSPRHHPSSAPGLERGVRRRGRHPHTVHGGRPGPGARGARGDRAVRGPVPGGAIRARGRHVQRLAS